VGIVPQQVHFAVGVALEKVPHKPHLLPANSIHIQQDPARNMDFAKQLVEVP
jgi:hypothetical protein